MSWRTPFEVYFGRRNNRDQHPLLAGASNVRSESFHDSESCLPRPADYYNFEQKRQRCRKAAATATKRCDERTIGRPKTLPSRYNLNENILFKYRDKRHKVPKAYNVLVGKIVECQPERFRYKVCYRNPETTEVREDWFSVKDITSLTKAKEAERQKRRQPVGGSHCNKYYIPQTLDDRLAAITSQGFRVVFNPAGDGNCQFSAMAFVLQNIAIHRSAERLREEVVSDLDLHRYTSDHTPLELFVRNGDFEAYLRDMGKDGTYGDHITLQRASEIYSVQFAIVSSLGEHASQIISPTGNFE